MQSTLLCTYPEIPRIEHLITYSYGLHLEEVACVAGAVLFQAGKKVFQVIKGSEKTARQREVVEMRPGGSS